MWLPRFAFPAQDILVIKDAENREWMWEASISELDGRYLFLSVTRDTARVCIFPSEFLRVIVSFTLTGGRAQKNLLWVADLQENEIGQNIKWEKLIDEFEAEYSV